MFSCSILEGCRNGFNLWQGRCYRFELGDNFNWEEANSHCHNLGSELVSINSQAENNYVTCLIPDTSEMLEVWIGGTRIDAERWAWIDGSEWSWNDGWNSGEPNNQHNNEDRICLYGTKNSPYPKGKWNDASSGTRHKGLVCAYKL